MLALAKCVLTNDFMATVQFQILAQNGQYNITFIIYQMPTFNNPSCYKKN